MAKATAAFHKRDPKTGRIEFFDVGDRVPDHIARLVGEHVVDKKPAPLEVPDDVLNVTQAELDQLVAAAAGEKQFTQRDLDEAAEKAREALIAELEQLKGEVPKVPGDPQSPENPDPSDGAAGKTQPAAGKSATGARR